VPGHVSVSLQMVEEAQTNTAWVLVNTEPMPYFIYTYLFSRYLFAIFIFSFIYRVQVQLGVLACV